MSEQDRGSEYRNEAGVPVTAINATSTNDRSRSGSSAQPTALYSEDATVCFTDSYQMFSKLRSPPRTLIIWRTQLTSNSRPKEAETSHPVGEQNGLKQPTRSNFARPGALPARCQYASIRRQNVRGSREKKQQLIEYSNA
ncbi:hypothetical protein FHG87_010552 [Trinorchestia longiramus]|nr:hypothetical protein FHG87_010552 [Trinorchestia longiramus]